MRFSPSTWPVRAPRTVVWAEYRSGASAVFRYLREMVWEQVLGRVERVEARAREGRVRRAACKKMITKSSCEQKNAWKARLCARNDNQAYKRELAGAKGPFKTGRTLRFGRGGALGTAGIHVRAYVDELASDHT